MTFGIYNGKKYFGNLYSMLIAPPASNKGKAELAKHLIFKINKKIQETYLQEKESNEGIKKRGFLIPGNTSVADFELLLIESGNLVIAESETDVIANNFKQEWGNFSHILRQAYEHEMVQRSRKEEQISQIDEPKLSVFLAGTMNQLPKFIDNVEDGLFTRFCIYLFDDPTPFKYPFDQKQDLALIFEEYAEKALKAYEEGIKAGSVEFTFTEDQKGDFTDFYWRLNDKLTEQHGSAIRGVVFRLAVQQFRIAMILAKMKNPTTTELICDEESFKASHLIAQKLCQHSVEAFKRLTSTENEKNRDPFLDKLPPQFESDQAIAIAIASGMSERAGYLKLDELQKKGKIEKVKRGLYRKI